MTLRDAIAEASIHIGRRDAETLLAHLLTQDRSWLFAHPEAELTAPQIETLRALTVRRAAHEPLQHLTGTQEFYGLPLRVTRDTLIPRPETELLVEAVLHWATQQPSTHTLRSRIRILDVGTGTGAIALALATHLPFADITACDISPAALTVAQENAQRLSLSSRIHFVLSDLLADLDAQTKPQANVKADSFDIIVSNPPYVPLTDAPTMQPEVVHHEPHTALFAGADGLDIYRRLIPQARTALISNGLLALEFGFGQREPLRSLLSNWHNLRFLDDYASIPRIVLANRPS